MSAAAAVETGALVKEFEKGRRTIWLAERSVRVTGGLGQY